MPTLITLAVTGLAGTAITGMLLMGMPWSDDEASRRDPVLVDNQEVDDVDDDPTGDLTRDAYSRDSALSRATRASWATGARDRDVSVDASPTSGVTRGTVSGGAGTHDGRIGSGGGGGEPSRDSSRASRDSGGSRSRG